MAKFIWYLVLLLMACHNSRSGSCESLTCVVNALKMSSEIKQVEFKEGQALIKRVENERQIGKFLMLLADHEVISSGRNKVTKKNTVVVIFNSGKEIQLFFSEDKVFYNGVNYRLIEGDLLSYMSNN